MAKLTDQNKTTEPDVDQLPDVVPDLRTGTRPLTQIERYREQSRVITENNRDPNPSTSPSPRGGAAE